MRIRRLETVMFAKMMPSLEPRRPAIPGTTQLRVPAKHEDAMLRAFLDNTKDFDNLRRYTTPIERAYHNAIAELTKLQNQRKLQEIGSVSQNRKQHVEQTAAALETENALTEKPISVHRRLSAAGNEVLKN